MPYRARRLAPGCGRPGVGAIPSGMRTSIRIVSESTIKGAIAEAAIASAAIELGIVVLRPLVEGRRYDLLFDTGDRLLRVQCKWAPRRGGVVVANLQMHRL